MRSKEYQMLAKKLDRLNKSVHRFEVLLRYYVLLNNSEWDEGDEEYEGVSHKRIKTKFRPTYSG